MQPNFVFICVCRRRTSATQTIISEITQRISKTLALVYPH